LPVAIYRSDEGRFGDRDAIGTTDLDRIAFFAPDKLAPGLVPVYETRDEGRVKLTTVRPAGQGEPIVAFYVLPSESTERLAPTRPLYELVHSLSGERTYSTETSPEVESSGPIGFVWENPVQYVWNIGSNG